MSWCDVKKLLTHSRLGQRTAKCDMFVAEKAKVLPELQGPITWWFCSRQPDTGRSCTSMDTGPACQCAAWSACLAPRLCHCVWITCPELLWSGASGTQNWDVSVASPTHYATMPNIHVCMCVYTVRHKKTCHFVFDNNSGISWSIFILFVPVETGRNTLQFTYLMAWWRHNCITSHVTKVCFIQLLHLVKYFDFEDRPKNFCQKLVGMWKCFSRKTDKRIGKEEHWTNFCVSC